MTVGTTLELWHVFTVRVVKLLQTQCNGLLKPASEMTDPADWVEDWATRYSYISK